MEGCGAPVSIPGAFSRHWEDRSGAELCALPLGLSQPWSISHALNSDILALSSVLVADAWWCTGGSGEGRSRCPDSPIPFSILCFCQPGQTGLAGGWRVKLSLLFIQVTCSYGSCDLFLQKIPNVYGPQAFRVAPEQLEVCQ